MAKLVLISVGKVAMTCRLPKGLSVRWTMQVHFLRSCFALDSILPRKLLGIYVPDVHLRKGYSKIDTITEVKNEMARGESYYYFSHHVVLLFTLDVKNAFNSAKWIDMLNALKTTPAFQRICCGLLSTISTQKPLALTATRNIEMGQLKLNQGIRIVNFWIYDHGLSLALRKAVIEIISKKIVDTTAPLQV